MGLGPEKYNLNESG